MYSSKDLEKLWFFYEIEGQPKGVCNSHFVCRTMC